MGDNKWILYGAGLLAVVFLCFGCGGLALFLVVPVVRDSADRKARQEELRKIGNAMHDFEDKRQMPASKLEDVVSGGFLSDEDVIRKVRQGRYVVLWGAPLGKEEQPVDPSKAILAYDNEPERDGGRLVMMGDTFCRKLSDEEFRATPKMRRGPFKK